MAFLINLKEKLEAQKIYDQLNGKYETRFKANGVSYAFIAESIAGSCYDEDTSWMLTFENIDTHRLTDADNDNKVIKSFVEVVTEWTKTRVPYSFAFNGSHFQVFNKIAEGLKKSIKGYNVIDDTLERKDEETGLTIEGNPIGLIRWTKMVVEDDVSSEERSNTKQSDLEKTYEEPEDIKTNSKYTKFKKDDKLDKAEGSYGESFSEFKSRKLNEKVNQKDYKFYVTGKNKKGENKIESGWEFKEDAQDQVNELKDTGISGVKVLQRMGLNKLNLNPDNDSDWDNLYR